MAMRHPKATVLSGALSALFVMTVSAKDYLDFHFSVKGMCIRYDSPLFYTDTFHWTW